MLELLHYAESVAVFPEALYFYRFNASSFSRKYMPGRYKKVRQFYEETISLCDRLGYGPEIQHRLSKPYLAFTISAMKQEMNSDRPFAERKQSVMEFILDPVLQKVLEESKQDVMKWKQRVLFWTIRKKQLLLCCGLLTVQNIFGRG